MPAAHGTIDAEGARALGDNRFERLTRSLAAPRGRRAVLGGLVGSILSAGGAARTFDLARARAAQATPTAGQAAAGDPLRDLLALAVDLGEPDAPADAVLASFADSAAQMAAVGVESPAPGDDDGRSYWWWANMWLPFPVGIGSYVSLLATLGFDATRIEQSLELGSGPEAIAILRGRFELDVLRATWEQLGYEPVELPGVTAYSWPGIDPAVAQLTNIAVLPDGTLLAASRLDRLRRAADGAAGREPTLLARPAVATLVSAARPGLAGAFLLPGNALQNPAAAEPLSPVELALIGVTPGGPLEFERRNEAGTPVPFRDDPPAARFVLAMLMADASAATAAVPIIESRLATGVSSRSGEPWAALFAAWTVDVAPGAPVVLVEIEFAPTISPRLWLYLYEFRDLGFVSW
jgi:hypothetical protein